MTTRHKVIPTIARKLSILPSGFRHKLHLAQVGTGKHKPRDNFGAWLSVVVEKRKFGCMNNSQKHIAKKAGGNEEHKLHNLAGLTINIAAYNELTGKAN